jgi:CO/xanthine dehydrogenase Mo-binding subunit/aerobic-type carbon monoxide dehydrogenase small subunit (CoxS/CutS family)
MTAGSLRCVVTVNGTRHDLRVGPRQTLLQLLREDLGLLGTRSNCEQGECGACTVLLDGEAVNSCIVPAASVHGHAVTTIEGLGSDGRLDPVQQAFLEAEASQCGFCTPGLVMAARALLDHNPHPGPEEIRAGLAGNYCRCTGYTAVLEAVAAAAAVMPKGADAWTRPHITGETRYLADLEVPGMLHGAFRRLPCARARIREVDVAPALACPGVVRVFSAADFPEGVPRFGPIVADQPLLAADQVRYLGEPVALVVAESAAAARAGAAAVQVAYDELPPIFTRDEAMASPPLHDPSARPAAQARWADSNVMAAWDFSWGSLAEGEAAADLVIENTYRAPFAHHFTLEPFGAIAVPEDGGVRVLSPVQHPFVLRRVLSTMLGLPPEKVRVQPTPIGGGFGGKGYPKIEPVVAACSLLLGRPLKVALDAEESFLIAQREASEIRIRSGFTRDGGLVFHDIDGDYLVGAYTDISPAVVSKSTLYAVGLYRTPHARSQGRGLFTTTPPTTAFRGFGATHVNMAVEGQMNAAAHRLGMDPVALRLRNVRSRGDEIVAHDTPVDGDWGALLRRVADVAGWSSPKAPGRGRGVAFGMKANSAATSSTARVEIGADGRVTAFAGTTEMGQGTQHGLARIVAEALGLEPEAITVVLGDTGLVPFDSWTASSRSTTFNGNALWAACAEAVARLTSLAEAHLGAPAGAARLAGGRVVWDGTSAGFAEVVRAAGLEKVAGEGTFAAAPDPKHPLGGPAPFYEVVASVVELHLDAETGQVFIDKVTHASDVGRVIDRRRASRVDQGGNVQGLSLALSEQLVYGPGGLANGSSLDYRIATTGDVPAEMSDSFLENGDGLGTLGLKGLGEGGILAVGPAMCGAILDLTGRLITEIPVTPERLWRALSAGAAEAAK